jgi:ABC-type transport system involved in multi-copper enzyme maturation permease subunit
MSSLALSNSLRLLLLALLAITLYSQTWHLSPVFRFIQPVQSALSWLIYAPLRAFRLASTRDFGSTDVYVFLAQIALTLVLLGLALFSFSRRDVILRER